MTKLCFRSRWRLLLLSSLATALLCVRWNGFTLPLWLAEMHSGVVVSRASTDSLLVALSFDDGPDPTYTPRVLQILKRYGAKATFFEEGRMIRLHPDLARRVMSEGHVLGNHTETHPYIERFTRAGVHAEIAACDEALRSFVGIRTYLFRPPRGAWNPTIFSEARSRNDHIVLWTIALEHQATPAPGAMAARVLERVTPGAIILMHDGANRSRESTVEALPLLLDGLKARGYRFVTIPELLRIPGNAPIASEGTHPGQLNGSPG
jgi:peptidoglycan/xylan/chitin deacetylase (PgdA/CDA1 family)